nr:HAD hydrolase-like protein [Breoghania sp.]
MQSIMIGDRKHDLVGVRANAVAVIGVTYGYGSREELQAEKPMAIADIRPRSGIWSWNGAQTRRPSDRCG